MGKPPLPAEPDSLAARIASGVGLAERGDNALLGLIRGWRRIASLAAAAELAAVSEFTRRRHEQAKADGASNRAAVDAADVELGSALTLTTRSTQLLMDRADMLHELPAIGTALAAGLIDWPKALVLITGLAGQDPALARRIADQLLGRAPQQTTGQLRAALNRALLVADPEAAERRRQREERSARIERGPEPGGVTAILAGRCLPVTDTVTAWNRITALARQLRSAGADGNLDQLRVHVYLALLNGQAVTAPTSNLTPPAPVDPPAPANPGGPANPAAPANPAGPPAPVARVAAPELQPSPPTGNINLTVPLGTIAGFSDRPGQLGGFGPVTGFTARQLANGALGQPGVHWCVTITNDHGHAIGHGCASRIRPSVGPPAPSPGAGPPGGSGAVADDRAGPGESGWQFTVKVTALAGVDCDHARESPHYRPSPSLRHLIHIRNVCCTAPGCSMPASACDDDHTTPFDQGGRTCECDLGPLCRRHHRVKQAQGWRLEQPEPGVFAWSTPSGRIYTTGPTEHAS